MANLIISSGMAGLISARWLEAKGVPFEALDSAASPGEGEPSFAWRFREGAGQGLIELFDQEAHWESVSPTAFEREKTEFTPFDGDIEPTMRPFVVGNYRLPTQKIQSLVEPVSKHLAPHFRCNRFPVSIDIDAKKVALNDGSTVEYDRLIWAAPLGKLKSILNTVGRSRMAPMGKAAPGIPFVGLEWGTDVAPFPEDKTVVLTFRYKDEKLKAYGFVSQKNVSPESELFVSHWVTVPPHKVAANAEETAKCVRSLRREILKEFAELESHIKHEKILSYDCYTPAKPSVAKSLEVLPNVFYVGPEATNYDGDTPLWGPEVTLHNLETVFS